MNLKAPHPWDVTPQEAMEIQRRLRDQVITETTFDELETVAGIDCGFKDDKARAAVVVLQYADLQPVDQAVAEIPVPFPYVPGLLSFRETPAVLEALGELSVEPDLLILDGHGYSHPRRLGLACHVGVITDVPAIGCAKSRLIGEHEEPSADARNWVPLYDEGEVIGAVVRSRPGVSPIFVSIGHKVDLETAVDVVLHCCTKYRLPETTRYAHRVAGGEHLDLQPCLF
ncbi:MAG: deoxyribonuclease V [Anaerolineae bacterium]